MKSYTDLKQSKKLAEVLPLESADMRYQAYYDNMNNLKYIPRFVSTIIPLKADIPCWSLATLLSVLPEYHLSSPNLLGSMYCCRVKNIDIYADNPVNACVEMILELHELNLL